MKCLLVFTALFISMSVFGQATKSRFILNGEINIPAGKAYLMPASGGKFYYAGQRIFDKAPIIGGKFVISGPCPQPSMYLLCVEVDSVPRYISDCFIVGPGNQNISCNVDSIREIPGIRSKYMDELKNEYLPSFEVAIGKGKAEDERTRFFLEYARSHPKSFIILWALVDELTNKGYNPVLDTAYHSLAASIRNTFAGKALADKMATMRRLAVGASFPALSLLDTSMNKVKIDFSSLRARYVLVDFWDSHCGPCIGEFAELKKIYKAYEPNGFAIAGVSLDDKKYIPAWKKVIREHEFPWLQYLDMGGKRASDLLILSVPQQFLLDSRGKIVERNPDLKRLALFLKENLH